MPRLYDEDSGIANEGTAHKQSQCAVSGLFVEQALFKENLSKWNSQSLAIPDWMYHGSVLAV